MSPRARAGFTLIELLLVIGMIALLLGIGLGAFARLDLGDRVSEGLVQNVIRSAHNWSIARSAPARVRIDPAANTIRAEGLAVIGTWHFESLPPEGAFGFTGANIGGRLIEDGFVGRALSFVGEPARSRAEMAVEDDSAWNLRLGFALQCALRPEIGEGQVLDIGGAAGLETRSDGAIRGWFTSEAADEIGVVRRGPRSLVESPPGALVPGRWSKVELRYDRARLALLVDGVLVAEQADQAPVWKLEGPLVISPGQNPWSGAIDNLVVSAVAGADESRLPGDVAFAKDTPREIVFAPGGGLDREVHREPVRIGLEFDDGRKFAVQINLYGTVE